jgi:hypothetical protein
MNRIPEEVFVHQLLKWLKPSETVPILSSSNALFRVIRYQHLKFQVGGKDLQNVTLSKLLKKINPAEQLIVRCDFNSSMVLWEDHWRQIFTNEFSAPAITPKRFDIRQYQYLISAIHLSQILEISFAYCSTLTDVNCLVLM